MADWIQSGYPLETIQRYDIVKLNTLLFVMVLFVYCRGQDMINCFRISVIINSLILEQKESLRETLLKVLKIYH